MATYTVLRRATAAVVPLAARRAAVPSSSRAFHSAISVKLLLHKETTPFVPSRSFSNAVAKKTVEVDNLVQLLQTEIDRALKDHAEFEIPQEFPFEIEEYQDLHREHLYLKRQYEDETIYVRFRISCGYLFVTVVKANGMYMEFDVDGHPDKIVLFTLSGIKKSDEPEDHLNYKYCSDFDEDQQKAILNYLEIRGIPSIYNVVQEYMLNKDKKDKLVWLQNLKSFVEK